MPCRTGEVDSPGHMGTEYTQEVGKISGYMPQVPVLTTWGVAFLQRSMLLLCMVNLVITSMSDLTPVASRVIRWASSRHKPALSAVIMARLAWVRCGQVPWLWAGMQVLICSQALRLHPATYGNLCKVVFELN